MRPTGLHLRAAWRAAAFVGITAACYAAWLAVRPFLAVSSQVTWRWRNRVFRAWARGVVRAFGIRIAVQGRPPHTPFLLVANHLSYLDVVLLASQLDAVFVAKDEVARWPVLGALAGGMRTIFVDRDNRRDVARVGRLIEGYLNEGQGMVLFSEGTSTRGEAVLPFKPALLEVATREGIPVSYATLGYRTAADDVPAHLSVCWWGAMTFLPHFWGLMRLREISASVSFGDHAICAADRKALAAELRRAVADNFTPVVTAETACELTHH